MLRMSMITFENDENDYLSKERTHWIHERFSNPQLIEIQIVHPARPSMIFFFFLRNIRVCF